MTGQQLRRALPYACALAVMSFFGAILVWIAVTQPENRWWTAGDLAVGVAALVLVRARGRWPFAVALVTAAATIVSTAAIGPAFVAYVSFAKGRQHARTALVAGLLWVAAVVYSAGEGITQQLILAVSTMSLSLAALTAVALYLGSRRDLAGEREQRRAEAERHRLAEFEQVRLNERASIAREMHDVLAHRISLLSLHAAALAHRTDLSSEEVRLAATVIHESAQQSLTELRATLGSLREDEATAPPQPSWAELPSLIDEVRSAGQRVDVSGELDAAAVLPAQIGRHAYRIVQEALTNARKHAPGAPVRVHVSGRPGESLHLRVTNPELQPANSRGADGLGLVGLRERVDTVHGSLSASVEAGSFVLDAELPWEAAP